MENNNNNAKAQNEHIKQESADPILRNRSIQQEIENEWTGPELNFTFLKSCKNCNNNTCRGCNLSFGNIVLLTCLLSEIFLFFLLLL